MLNSIKSHPEIFYPVFIFLLKAPELCINALRIIMTAKGYKVLTAMLVFTEACLGITALTLVFSKLNNPVNIISFGLGMATGSYLGIILEKKIALGVVLVRVITQLPADELLVNLRKLGFRVTEVSGQSNYGKVGVLFAVVKRDNTRAFIDIVTRYNPKAFYTIEETSHVSQKVERGKGKDEPPKDESSIDTDAKEVLKRSANSLMSFFPIKF